MKYAVLYSSQTGNTKNLAEELFVRLPEGKKTFQQIRTHMEIPEADFYFVGFPVHNQSCLIDTMELLEQLENTNIALFASCGLPPVEQLQKQIERNVTAWINESCHYCGLYLCQGTVTEEYRNKVISFLPGHESVIEQYLNESHPDDEDTERLTSFVDRMTAYMNSLDKSPES